jgi:hypothetical protein
MPDLTEKPTDTEDCLVVAKVWEKYFNTNGEIDLKRS